MTNRPAFLRPRRWALPAVGLAMLLTILLVPTAPARAASAIAIEARALVGGRYEVGGWMALAVTLVNDGEPTQGDLAAATDAGAAQRFVEMPAGARKVVMLYVQPEAFQRRITVQYREPNGTVEAVVEVQVLEQASSQVAVVGDGTGTIRPQLSALEAAGVPAPLSLTVADIPERSEPLEGLSAIIWADDSSALTEAQRRSMERWVANGGQLVVVGGPNWQARTAAFADLLPLNDLTAVDSVAHAALASWSGSSAAAVDAATVSTGTLRDDARSLVRADDGTILASMRPVGAGRLILLGSDVASDVYRGWEGSPRLWARLLPSSAALEQFFGGGFPITEEAENAMGSALGSLPSLEVPPAELLLVVIVAYILLIGPISYLILRRLDRRELAWVTAPLLVVLFTACSFGIGTSLKGSDVIVNQISLIRASTAGGAATVESYAGIFSPDRSTYDLTVDADALMSRVRPTNFGNVRDTSSEVVVEQGDPAHLRGLAIGVFGFEAVRADTIVEHEPALSVTWRSEDGETIGTVTNEGELPVTDVAYVSSGGGDMIDAELAPGESAEFTVATRNLNGSSASDQVYGFGGFDSANDEQRRILVRRQVIDSLVGYAGFMPGMDMGMPGASAARGPYIVGWYDDPGPVPVVVDDLDAQRYAQSVEVLAVRPFVVAGEVDIGPAQMAVAIVATEGDITDNGPGMVMVGNGSVTYSVALPLEATDMSVSELAILVGPDPSMVFSQQGGFGGFWPAGYSLEIRDPTGGAWTLLGDISQQSRFEIDEPEAAMGGTGRIEVRITGTEVDQNFGQASVFVSAEARGVIGE
jgi:hypothetical protein